MPAEITVSQHETRDYQGFYENMPFEEYAAAPGLNGSSIVHMRRSPMAYKHYKDHGRPETPALALGIVTHRFIFEPRMVNYAVWGMKSDQKVRRGGVWDDFQIANEGKTILTVDEMIAISGISEAAHANLDLAKYITAEGPTEVSLFWRHPYTKRQYKCRLDKWIPSQHTVFDLKSTRDCHSYRFGAQAYQLGYNVKMAMQYQGIRELTGKAPRMRLGAIDSKAPHESACYRLTEDVILQGIEELDQLVAKLDDCEKSGKWPGEHTEETDLLLPTWATDNPEDEE